MREGLYVDDIGDENIVGDNKQFGEKNMCTKTEKQSNDTHAAENNMISKEEYQLKSKRGREGKKEINKGKSQSSAIYKIVKRNDCTEWTVDLSAKFTNAAHEHDE